VSRHSSERCGGGGGGGGCGIVGWHWVSDYSERGEVIAFFCYV